MWGNRHDQILEQGGGAMTTPLIQGKLLEPTDIGRNVTYTTSHGDKHFGQLSSYRDDGAIFVRFNGPRGERCPAEKLTWG
jgi:hypothetical protein